LSITERIDNLNYVLDLMIIIVIIGCAAAGSRKGAVKMLLTLVGYVAAVAAATFVSNVASGYVYDSLVKPYVISALEAKSESLGDEYLSQGKVNEILEEYGLEITEEQLSSIKENEEQYSALTDDEKIREILEGIFKDYCEALTETFSGIVPEEIIEEAERYIEKNNIGTERMLNLVTQEKDAVIKVIENEIVRPVMIKTVKYVLFAVTFAVVMIVVSIVAYAAKLIRKIPVVNSADSFLGTIFGIVQGLLYTVLVNIGVSFFIKLTADANEYLNTAVISETYVFELLYNATFYTAALILK